MLSDYIKKEYSKTDPNNYNYFKNKINQAKKCDSSHKNLVKFFQMLFTTEVQPTCFTQYTFENVLFEFSKKLLHLSLCLESIYECKINGANRVVHIIPPAAKGKNSTKDCIIFEETFYLSNLLRNNGFTKKIVFTSSNTKEYFKDNKPIPQIADELENSKIEIATSLSHGYHLVQKEPD